jgi:CRP/FNR family transcriptional regulator, cyclic AMP receptor protein
MTFTDPHDGQCELHGNLQALKKIQYFSTIAPDFLQVMAFLCERKIFAPEQTMLTKGEPAEAALILIRGSACIKDGEAEIVTVHQGECVGGLTLLGRFQWLYSLQAVTEVECLVLPRRTFLPQLMAQPATLATVVRELISVIVEWDQRRLAHPEKKSPEGLSML